MNKEYITDNTSIIKLAKFWGFNINSNNMLRCPFHDDKTPSMKLYKKNNSFYCFGCQLGGDIFDFVQKVKNCDFNIALMTIIEIFNLDERLARITPVRYRPLKHGDATKALDEEKLSKDKEIFQDFYSSLELTKIGFDYLTRRGFNKEIISEYGLRSSDPATMELEMTNFTKEEVVGSGLIKESSFNTLRPFFTEHSIIIPTFDEASHPTYFTARSIYEKKHYKMINRPSELFVKNLLPEKQYIFESVFDAMSFHQLTGNNNVISINGLSGLIKLVCHKFIDKKLILCLDNDKAAEIAQENFRKKRDFEVFNFESFASKMKVHCQVKDFNELLVKLKK